MDASAATPCRRERSWRSACRARRVMRPKAKGTGRGRCRAFWSRGSRRRASGCARTGCASPCLAHVRARRVAVRSLPQVRRCRTKASPAAVARGPSWGKPLFRPRCRRRRVGGGSSCKLIGFRRRTTTITSHAVRFRAHPAVFAGVRGAWPPSDGGNGAAAALPSSPPHSSSKRQPSSQTGRHALLLLPVRSTKRRRNAQPNLPIGAGT